jgi:hypothetical protein
MVVGFDFLNFMVQRLSEVTDIRIAMSRRLTIRSNP